ncbi:MAG: hypothetical protein ACOYOS_23560 [Syntrophales bacterium]
MSRRKFFILLFTIVAIFQVASIFSPHVEGDELVFLTLSKNMGWDLSNYTVMSDAPFNQFPNRLYRQPVFMHPPLFPLILKVGSSLVNPVLFGLLFNGLLKFALAIVMWHFALALGASLITAQFVAIFVTACPILGFVSSRLLVDMGFTISLVAMIYLLIRAGIDQHRKNIILAVICCCLLLNTKIQAITYLPLFAFLYVVAARSALKKGEMTPISVRNQALICVALIGIIGFSHHFRLLFSLGLRECLHLMDGERPLNPFVSRIADRSPLKFIVYLVMIHPIVLMLIRPRFWIEVTQSLGPIPRPIIYLGLSLLYSVLATLFSSGAQERYWAHIFPLAFLFLAVLYEKRMEIPDKRHALKLLYASYFTLLFMNNFEINVLLAGSRTAIVFPAILELLPFLSMKGGPFYNF